MGPSDRESSGLSSRQRDSETGPLAALGGKSLLQPCTVLSPLAQCTRGFRTRPRFTGIRTQSLGDLSGRQGFLPSIEHAHKQILDEETPRPSPESRLLSCSFSPLGARTALMLMVSPALFLSARPATQCGFMALSFMPLNPRLLILRVTALCYNGHTYLRVTQGHRPAGEPALMSVMASFKFCPAHPIRPIAGPPERTCHGAACLKSVALRPPSSTLPGSREHQERTKQRPGRFTE